MPSQSQPGCAPKSATSDAQPSAAFVGEDGQSRGCANPDCCCVPYDGGPLASDRMPWKVAVCDDGWPMVHNEGDIICVPDANHHAGCAWDLARFRLIAAAPDLYEALKTAERLASHSFCGEDREHLEAMRAALAKAEGR